MGDMADYYLDLAFDEEYCDMCGEEIDRCQCDFGADDFTQAVAVRRKMHSKVCTGTPVVRTNKTSKEQFVGCSEFPKCRYSEPKR